VCGVNDEKQMKNNKNHIALLDEKDNIIGYEKKLKVHQLGILHRAFSIFVFNEKGEVLLQKRAATKYHSPNLWTNTCCSHLIEDSNFVEYIHQRLENEMGFDCELEFKFSFHYKIKFSNSLTENKIDHVYFGKWKGTPIPNPKEAEDYKWIDWTFLKTDLKINPEKYTYWVKEAVENKNMVME
jgi:isopentenyl-diphosphate delta-isomerase